MASNLSEHLAALEMSLRKFDKNKRLAFAMWCCQVLWERFCDSLKVAVGSERRNDLCRLLQSLWDCVIYHQMPMEEMIYKAKQTLKTIECSDATVNAESELGTFGAIELLGCVQKCLAVFENGSAKSASECAEHVINFQDYALAFLSGERHPLSHPDMQKEIQSQDEMVDHLVNNEMITEADKKRFRS